MRRSLCRAAAAAATVVGLVVVGMAVPAGVADADPSGYSVLQINMCNSGLAKSCYEGGKATSGAAELIAARRPSVVTVNEMCETDIDAIKILTRYEDFETFTQSGTQRCKHGKGAYGNALLFPPGTSVSRLSPLTYIDQSSGSEKELDEQRCEIDKKYCGTEKRTLACAVADGVTVCVTHLAKNRKVARAQAGQMSRYLSTQIGSGPRILGGDWNLKNGGDPDAQDFVPAGMFRKGDGNVQHVLASSAHFRFERVREMDLSWTDHPGFEVYYTRN